jgi:hypothetical protein
MWYVIFLTRTTITVNHEMKSDHFILIVLSGGSCSAYLATAEITDGADYHFDSFNDGRC